MATCYYYFRAAPFSLEAARSLVPTLGGLAQVAPTVTQSGFLVVALLEPACEGDLLAAMTSLGYTLDESTLVPPPAFETTRYYGSLAAPPTTPLPVPGDCYYNTTSSSLNYYSPAGWTTVFVGPAGAVNNNVMVFAGTSGGAGQDSGISLAQLQVAVAASRFVLNYTFNSQAQPYVSANGTTFTALGSFRFPGTAAIGTPLAIRTVMGRISGVGLGTLRLLNVTNAVVLGQAAGITTAFPSIQSIPMMPGSFPVNEAIVEVQVLRTGGAAVMALSALDMEF